MSDSTIRPRALTMQRSPRRRPRVFLYATVVVVIMMVFVSAIINDRVLRQQMTTGQEQEQEQQWQRLRQNESTAPMTPHTDKTRLHVDFLMSCTN